MEETKKHIKLNIYCLYLESYRIFSLLKKNNIPIPTSYKYKYLPWQHDTEKSIISITSLQLITEFISILN